MFKQTVKHQISSTVASDFCQQLPQVIRKHTDWEYAYQQQNTGCLLKPVFRHMPYRNSFVPEIKVTVDCQGAATILHLCGRPVRSVRILMALWFGLLSVFQISLFILAVTSVPVSLFPLFLPLVMGGFGYFLCKLSTKAVLRSIAAAIRKEFP